MRYAKYSVGIEISVISETLIRLYLEEQADLPLQFDQLHHQKKQVFSICDQIMFKPPCSATGTSKNMESLHVAGLAIILCRESEQQRH